MATEAFNFGTPAVLDQLDGGGGGTVYMLGGEYDSDVDAPVFGVRWYAPATTPGVTCIAKLYRESDGAEMATSDGAGFTPTTGQNNDILFTTPFNGLAGVLYVPAVLTRRYTFTAPGGFTFTSSPAGVLQAHRGRFKIVTAGNPAFPNTTSTTNFHIGPLVDLEDPALVDLTAAVVTLTAQALTATPGMVSVDLTSAAAAFSAVALTGTPGPVTTSLSPAELTLSAPQFTATPGVVTVALAAATLTLEAMVLFDIATGFRAVSTRSPAVATSTRTNFARTGGG